ncbi:MAG: hypothetical protein AAF985_15045, partial [Bacteroidota bacterium]
NFFNIKENKGRKLFYPKVNPLEKGYFYDDHPTLPSPLIPQRFGQSIALFPNHNFTYFHQ